MSIDDIQLPHIPFPWEENAQVRVAPEDLNEALEWRESFSGLMQHPGWIKLMEIAEVQLRNRRDRYELKTIKPDEVLEEQFTKGENAGMRLLMALPTNLLEQANEIVETAREIEEANTEQQETE